MAQTNYTPISLYYSATASNVPVNTNLVAGELAINTNDGKLFYKDSSGVVQTLASKAAASGTFSQLTIGSTQLGAGNASAFKNRIINGAMVIDQRNAGASVTPTNGQYTLDRWASYLTASGKFTVQQNAGSVTPPAGFTNYLGCTSTSAYSLGVSDEFEIVQPIEGYNVADLDFGKSTAKTITVSFWVRSSLTGTFGGSVYNSAVDWCYPFSYTISVANTWEQKFVTITGQTSGTWLTTNGTGMNVLFSLGAGSNRLGTANAWVNANRVGVTGQINIVGTSGATFYITGVQLEVGTNATSFDYRPYGTELALCQRYYQSYGSTTYAYQSNASSSFRNLSLTFPVTMRTSPTVSLSGGTGPLSVATATANAFFANVNIGNTTSDAYITNYTASAEL